jgi:GH24 family phage-related lysozyme (muramidase)
MINKIKKILLLFSGALGATAVGVATSPALQEAVQKNFNIDWSFIRSLEGFKLNGYVPKETAEKNNKVVSGVTIASGFDLGQHSTAEILFMNFPKPLKDKLIPYAGLKGKEAKKVLSEIPLRLTQEEAELVDIKVKEAKARKIAEAYNKSSELDFYSLPSEAQTVIMSVAFQYGDLKSRTPNFWRIITKGDWDKAVHHLKNFGDVYKTRRRKEAAYLSANLRTTPNKNVV